MMYIFLSEQNQIKYMIPCYAHFSPESFKVSRFISPFSPLKPLFTATIFTSAIHQSKPSPKFSLIRRIGLSMAYFRYLENRSNLLTWHCHPSVGYILHQDDHSKHDSIVIAPSLQGISYFSGFANSSMLESLKDRRCVDFAFSSTTRASFLQRMSTSNGGWMTDVADTTVQAVSAQASAVNEVAVAAADSFGPIAKIQH